MNVQYKHKFLKQNQLVIKNVYNLKNVVEIGVGEGTPLVQLAKAGMQDSGIDISKVMVTKAKKNFAKNGLDKWFKQKWVDIGSKKKDGSFSKCGRSKQKADAKRKYPKCVPLAKATRMSDSQRASAVKRKRAAGNTGPKPTNVATFKKRKRAFIGGII